METLLASPVIVSSIGGLFAVLLLVLQSRLNKQQNQLNDSQKQLNQAIQTNHGSKNLGDAIDRLTEQGHRLESNLAAQHTDLLDIRERVSVVREQQITDGEKQERTEKRLHAHIEENDRLVSWGKLKYEREIAELLTAGATEEVGAIVLETITNGDGTDTLQEITGGSDGHDVDR